MYQKIIDWWSKKLHLFAMSWHMFLEIRLMLIFIEYSVEIELSQQEHEVILRKTIIHRQSPVKTPDIKTL